MFKAFGYEHEHLMNLEIIPIYFKSFNFQLHSIESIRQIYYDFNLKKSH